MSSGPTASAFLRYVGLGGMTFLLYVGLTALLHEVWELPETAAFAIAIAIVYVLNFFLARHFVYDSSGGIGTQATRFLFVSLAARACEYAAFAVLHVWLGLYYLLSIVLVTAVSVVVKFFVYRSMVFERQA